MEVTVVIPAYNSTATLPLQLEALAGQDFAGSWELVIADNGSSDDLHGCVARCAVELAGLPDWRIIDASRLAGASYARTIALLHVRSELVAFCDADDVVCPGWLGALVEGLAEHDLVTGPTRDVTSAQLEAAGPAALFGSLDADDERTRSTREGGGIWGCNAGIRRHALSGFAPDLLFLEDAAVARRATEAGMSRGWVADAIILYRQSADSRVSFSKGLGNGVGTVELLREFPELGSALPHPLKSLGWLVLHAPDTLSPPGRARWSRAAGRYGGVLLEQLLPGLHCGRLRARAARRRRQQLEDA